MEKADSGSKGVTGTFSMFSSPFNDLHLHIWTHIKMPLKINLIYWGNMEIYCIF